MTLGARVTRLEVREPALYLPPERVRAIAEDVAGRLGLPFEDVLRKAERLAREECSDPALVDEAIRTVAREVGLPEAEVRRQAKEAVRQAARRRQEGWRHGS